MSGIRAPEQIKVSELSVEDFDLWVEAFNDYLLLKEPEADDKRKSTYFLSIGGLSLRRVVKGLELRDAQFTTLLEAVRHYFQPLRNVVLERYSFFNMKQEEGEELGAFLVRLRLQGVKCDFNDITKESIPNQLLRDQYIRGMRSQKIIEVLLGDANLTLTAAIEKAEGIQQAIKDTNTLSRPTEAVMAFQQSSYPRKFRNDAGPSRPANNVCFTCGKPNHVAKNCYKNMKCKICNRVGHTANVCRSRKIQFIEGGYPRQEDTSERIDVLSLQDNQRAGGLKYAECFF